MCFPPFQALPFRAVSINQHRQHVFVTWMSHDMDAEDMDHLEDESPIFCGKLVVPCFCQRDFNVSESLVGGIRTPLKNVKVNWDDDIPN